MKEKLNRMFQSEGYKKFEKIEKGLIVGMFATEIIACAMIFIGK